MFWSDNMSENEVIYRLKEHLKAKKMQRGFNNSKDLYYCINYIMDFLYLNRKEAKQFYKEKIKGE